MSPTIHIYDRTVTLSMYMFTGVGDTLCRRLKNDFYGSCIGRCIHNVSYRVCETALYSASHVTKDIFA